jgi:ABC-type uncharacterized transport system involved in gliding motility auxiliary subunit
MTKKKFWKYFVWVGPFLMVMGLSAGVVSETWGVVPLGLLISGSVITGLWLVIQSKQSQWWGRRSTQAGTNALAATLAVVMILGLVNFLAVRYHVRQDFTETGLFTLAPQSQQLVRDLRLPIKVWVFSSEQNPLDREMLENFRRQGKQFSFEYVDPQARPGLAEKFGVKEVGEVYIESPTQNRRQLVQVVNENERLREVRLTNRLQRITSDRTAKVYFLQGHGEHPLEAVEGGMSQAVAELNEKNFTPEPLNLADRKSVPREADVVVVAGAQRALFDTEVEALRNFLTRGGNLMLMIDPNTSPNLGGLLTEWGISLDNRLAVDMSGGAMGPAVPLVTEYGKHPITQDFGNGISFYRLARPLEIKEVPGIEATPLLLTKPYPGSWAESDLQNENLQFNPESDKPGPLTLGVALSRKLTAVPEEPQPTPTPSPIASPTASPTASPGASPTTATQEAPKPTPGEARMVVIGNSDFATNGLLQQQLNGDVFLNSVTWLSQQDTQALSIRPKEAKNRRINLSASQANLLVLLSVIILPLLGFGGAGILWWQRR